MKNGRARRRSAPDPGAVRILRWVVILLLVANGCAFVSKGANRPADPVLVEPGGTAAQATGPTVSVPARRALAGFGEIGFRVDGAGAAATLRCALLADSPEQQAKGLMGVTDLGGYDGMIFRFATTTTGSFYMKDTPMPLSIAWFDASGRFVSLSDMQPCLNQPTCPLYSAAGPYRYALEVPKGSLGRLSVGPGTTITFVPTCP